MAQRSWLYAVVVEQGHKMLNLLRYGTPTRYGRITKILRGSGAHTILEIGTRTGRTAERMMAAALADQGKEDVSVTYYGFDLFEDFREEILQQEGALRPASLDDVRVRLEPFTKRGVEIHLIKGDTNQTLPATAAELPLMDFVFIDGGHSYETVLNDWRHCQQLLHERSVVLFDDYVNERTVKELGFGVNDVVDEIDRSRYDVRLLEPEDVFVKDWGLFRTRLALVKPVPK